MAVTVTNDIEDVVLIVRYACPGIKPLGLTIAHLNPGQSIQVHTDFIAEVVSPYQAAGDKFDVWYGGGWQEGQESIGVVRDKDIPSYLDYVPKSPHKGASLALWPMPQSVSVSGGARFVEPGFEIETAGEGGRTATVTAIASRYAEIIKAMKPTRPASPAQQRAIAAAAAAHTELNTPTATPSKDQDAEFKPIILQRLGRAMSAVRAAPPAIKVVLVTVATATEVVSAATNYSYTIAATADSSTVQISAVTAFGAAYALETFTQMLDAVDNGPSHLSQLFLNGTEVAIRDDADYAHRGVMVDSGRRFITPTMLEQMIDAMSYTKMNVLHLHLSDWPGVRMEVPALPELTSQLEGQYYTAKDITALVEYARQRGVRIIPEVDVPGHSAGFAPLEARGLQFCDARKLQLYHDPKNVTLNLVKTVLKAVATAFKGEMRFHAGGDETRNNSLCTWSNIHAFEEAVQDYVTNTLRLGTVVWNEVYSDPKTSEPNALRKTSTVQNWHGADTVATTAKGYSTISSNYNTQYLDQQCCAAGVAAAASGDKLKQCYWEDIAAGIAPTAHKQRSLLLGGEVAMWGDLYCPEPHCPENGQYSWMYPTAQDSAFWASFQAMVWPRAAASGAAFWNYDTTLAPTSKAFIGNLTAHNARLIARGIGSCPNGCVCDWGHQCGKPYGADPKPPLRVQLTNRLTATMRVRAVTPCTKGYGATLATLAPGKSTTVGQDFIVETPKPAAAGDPFDVWFGGPGWRDVDVSFDVIPDPSTPGYLIYNMTSPVPPFLEAALARRGRGGSGRVA